MLRFQLPRRRVMMGSRRIAQPHGMRLRSCPLLLRTRPTRRYDSPYLFQPVHRISSLSVTVYDSGVRQGLK